MMIKIQVDEQEIRSLYLQKIEEKIKQIDKDLVFWDTTELKRRTCMSWNTIQERFFYHPDFPKFKVGGKWYFPAEKTKAFLLEWLESQGSQNRKDAV